MTIPAHDSVAYLPARPRLALLRKEADQLIFMPSLPYPATQGPMMGLVFRRRRGRAILPAWRLGARQTRLLFEDWMRLAFDACAPVAPASHRLCVELQR